MYLLFIFALMFMPSTQMKDEDRMLERIMGAIGEEGLAQLMNTLEANKLDRLMDCLEQECKDEEFVEIMPRVLEIIKGINSGKAGCSLIKTFIKDGPIHDMVTELREEDMIKAMSDLNAKHIQILISMDKGKVKITDLVELGKKILPIIQNAKYGKGMTKLIETLKNAEQILNSFSSRRSGRWSNNQGSSGGRRRGGRRSNNQGGTNGGGRAPMPNMNGGGGAPMPGMQGGGGGRMPNMNGGGGAPMPGMQGGAGGRMPNMNGGGGAPMPGMQGGGGGRMPGMNGGGGAPMPGMSGTGGAPMPDRNGAGGAPMPGMQGGGEGRMPAVNGGGGAPMPGMNGGGGAPMPGKNGAEVGGMTDKQTSRK